MEGNRPVKLLDLLWRLKPFSSLAGPYFHANRSASIQVAILIALTLLTQVIYVIFSYIQRNIFNSLVDKDANQFYLVVNIRFFILTATFFANSIACFAEYCPIRSDINHRYTYRRRKKVTSHI